MVVAAHARLWLHCLLGYCVLFLDVIEHKIFFDGTNDSIAELVVAHLGDTECQASSYSLLNVNMLHIYIFISDGIIENLNTRFRVGLKNQI